MINFYRCNPEYREKVGLISQRTWSKCPEIKEALSDYTKQSPKYVKHALSKRNLGKVLTDMEQRAIQGYYYHFWNDNPEYKDILGS